jgi:hypothetical protein
LNSAKGKQNSFFFFSLFLSFVIFIVFLCSLWLGKKTPLHLAALMGRTEAAEELLKNRKVKQHKKEIFFAID